MKAQTPFDIVQQWSQLLFGIKCYHDCDVRQLGDDFVIATSGPWSPN